MLTKFPPYILSKAKLLPGGKLEAEQIASLFDGKVVGHQKRGRPIEKPLPEPIPDTPENIARALLTTPPKKEEDWDYLKDAKDQGASKRRAD